MSEGNAKKDIPLYTRGEFLRNGLDLMLNHDPGEYASLESGKVIPLFRSEDRKANIARLLQGYENERIYSVHRWPSSVADEIVEESARIITAEDLSAEDAIEEYFYDMPIWPSDLRERLGDKDVFIAATGLSYPRSISPLLWEAVFAMHEHQAFDWHDPERKRLATKAQGLLREDLPEAATILAAFVAMPSTFPLRIIVSALQNTNRFRLVSTYAIKNIPGVSPETEMIIGRLNKLPLSSSDDIDLIHALAGIKLHEFQDFIRETEGVDSPAIALYTGDDRFGKDIWSHYMQQEAIIAESTRSIFEHLLEFAKLRGVELTDAMKEKTLDDVVYYFGSVKVRRVTKTPEWIYRREAEKYLPAVDYPPISPTIQRIVTSVGNNVLGLGLVEEKGDVSDN